MSHDGHKVSQIAKYTFCDLFVYVYMIMTVIKCMNEMDYHNFTLFYFMYVSEM